MSARLHDWHVTVAALGITLHALDWDDILDLPRSATIEWYGVRVDITDIGGWHRHAYIDGWAVPLALDKRGSFTAMFAQLRPYVVSVDVKRKRAQAPR